MNRGVARDFFDDYTSLLDARAFDAWLDLFEDDASYAVAARENFDQGLPLATIRADSRAMLADRVRALLETQFFAPRSHRHVVSAVKVTEDGPDTSCASASFIVAETIDGELTTISTAGEYRSTLACDTAGTVRIRSMTAIYDGSLIDTSLIYPL